MIRLETPDATEEFGGIVASILKAGDVIALFGELGAGKTTFSRGLLRGLGFEGDVASPTFPLVQVYEGLAPPVWHVDLYRIEDPEDALELGLDEARTEAALVIEWPERLGAALWPDALQLRLSAETGGGRSLTAGVPAAWESRWPPR